MIRPFLDHLVESEEGAFIPPNSMATPETMSPVPSTIERLPTDYDNGEKKVIVAGKKKLRQKSFKENLDYNRDVLISRVVPALMIGNKLYTTERGKSHADIKRPNRGSYVWGYHDPVSKKFYHWGDLKVDATELRPEGGYRMNPRLWRTMTEGYSINEAPVYHVTLTKNVPTIRKKGILPFGGPTHKSNWQRAGDKSRYGQGEIYGFEHETDANKWAANWDWKLNKTIGSGKVSVVKLDSPDTWEEDTHDQGSQAGKKGRWLKIMKRQRPETITDIQPFDQESSRRLAAQLKEGYDPATYILRSRVIPAGRDQWGKVHLGERGQTHGFILAGLMKKGFTKQKGYKGVEYGYHDPLTKKFYSRTELGFDATELPEFKRRWEETIQEAKAHNMYDTLKFKESSQSRKDLLKRIRPAIQERKTKKLYVGNRGEWHPIIAHNNGLEDYSYQETTMANGKYKRGFLDPKKKRFISAYKMGIDAAELPMDKITRMRIYGEELQDYERQILKTRAIPALKHPVTGKIHLGKRGQDHIDLADSVFANDKEGLKHYTELEHSGYIDSASKKFYSRREAGFDSSEIMTGMQRMRKYNTEETLYATEEINPKLLHRLRPAIRVKEIGKVFKGERGESHWEIADHHDIPYGENPLRNHSYYDRGYHDPKTKKFYTSKQLGGLDAADLYAPVKSSDSSAKQAMIRYLHREETLLDESPTAKFRPEYTPILHNPSYSALLRQHIFAAGGAAMDNPFSKKHELRYLASRDGKHVWTVDAAEMIHDEMANKVGINTKMDSKNQAAYWTHHHYLGNIRSHHLTVIKKHPKGLVGWIQDRHRNSPGTGIAADYSREKE